MSLRDYLHEKAEESRHNETIEYLITGEINSLVGLTFNLVGLVLLALGIALCIH